MLLWGVFAFALCPILQLLIIDQAHEAPNLGNAAGAWIVGMVLAALLFIYLQRRRSAAVHLPN